MSELIPEFISRNQYLDLAAAPWVKTTWEGKKYIQTQELSMYMRRVFQFYRTDENNLYLFVGDRYVRISTPDCFALIKYFLPEKLRIKKHWQAVYDELMTDFSHIAEDDFNANEDIICFQNGVLHLSTGRLKPHSPDYLITVKIPCEYKPDLTLEDAPIFNKFLNELSEGDEEIKVLLLEFLGAIVSNVAGYRWKKLLYLYGPGNTGKTVFREIAIRLAGPENSVSIDIKRIGERFGTAALHRKRLAGCGDTSYIEHGELTTIKALTGGDSIFAEEKGRPSFSFIYRGLLWFNGNGLPFFRQDRGEYVYSRFLVVPCHNIIPVDQRDPQLIEKILTERSAIVSVAINHLKEAINRGYKFTEGETILAARAHYQTVNSSLFTFVDECCELDEGFTKRSEFNASYIKWCQSNHFNSERPKDIGGQLKAMFGLDVRKRHGDMGYDLAIKEEAIDELFETESILARRGQKGQRNNYY